MKKILSLLLLSGLILTSGFIPTTLYAVESFYDLQSFYSSTLTSSVGNSATTLKVTTAPAISTGFMVMEPRTANQEIVLMTGRSGTTLTVVRGLAEYGTSTANAGNGRPHAAGTRVEIVDVHYYIKMLQAAPSFQYRGATTTSAMLSGITNPNANDLAFVTNDERFYKYSTTTATWVKQGDNTETIEGTKTFSSPPQVPYDTASSSASSVGYANTKVSLTGDQTITGTKTFSSSPVVPTPSGNTDAANKEYVDVATAAGCADANETTNGCVQLATKAQAALGTSVSGTGDRLVLPASMATSTSQVATTSAVITKTNGKIDQSFLDLTESFAFTGTTTLARVYTAGETINGATLPVPVYASSTDSRYYAADGNELNKLRFAGFAISNSTAGNNINIQTSGIVGGFSGLTTGSKYYVQDSVGTVGTTPGTYEILVGIATSPTEILIQKGRRYASGTLTRTGDGDTTITTGFRASKISIKAIWSAGNNDFLITMGGWTKFNGNGLTYMYYQDGTDADSAGLEAAAFGINESTNNGTVSSVTDNTFVLTVSGSGAGNTRLYWEAEGDL